VDGRNSAALEPDSAGRPTTEEERSAGFDWCVPFAIGRLPTEISGQAMGLVDLEGTIKHLIGGFGGCCAVEVNAESAEAYSPLAVDPAEASDRAAHERDSQQTVLGQQNGVAARREPRVRQHDIAAVVGSNERVGLIEDLLLRTVRTDDVDV
jgi:hypothetical protein